MRTSQMLILRTGFRLLLSALLGQMCLSGVFAAQPSAKPASAAPQTAARIDVNSADLQALETLPGVGPATAKRIVEERPFKTLSDLEKVKGLSKAKVEALKDKVTFGPVTSAQTVPSTKSAQGKRTAASPVSAGAASSPSGAAVKSQPSSSVATPKSTTAAAGEKLAPGQQLNINTASAADLEKLPGIGPTKAQAIAEYRTQNGNFKSIEDIQKVKGIKAGLFSKIKDYIKVSD